MLFYKKYLRGSKYSGSYSVGSAFSFAGGRFSKKQFFKVPALFIKANYSLKTEINKNNRLVNIVRLKIKSKYHTFNFSVDYFRADNKCF